MNRRDFLTASGLLAIAGVSSSVLGGCSPLSGSDAAAKGVKQSYDTQVLVVGGGPAGVCAAIAAARHGVRTMLIEQGGALGGMATLGLVAPFMTCYDTKGEQMIIRGLFEEVVDRMVALGGAIHPSKVRLGSPYTAWITTGHDHCTPIDAEIMKLVLDQMCAEAGVKVLLHATLVNPVMRKNRVKGAVVLTRSGLEAIKADIVVDCTGDGDFAARAGAPCEFGNPETGRVQPATLFFHINNVDSRKLEADVESKLHTFRKVNGVSHRALHWHVEKAIENGEWDIARKSVNVYKGVRDDEWAVNCTRIARVDARSSESLTMAEIEGRRQVKMIMDFFHKYVPGCRNATLKASGSTVGIRESRHVKGEYVLGVDDLLNGVVQENLSGIRVVKSFVREEHEKNKFQKVSTNLYKKFCKAERYMAMNAPLMMAMGQAAGIAAAIAVNGGTAPRNVDASELRKLLLKNKAFLG